MAKKPVSIEQMVRDMLERMEIEDAQSFSSGELIELANVLAAKQKAENRIKRMKRQRRIT